MKIERKLTANHTRILCQQYLTFLYHKTKGHGVNVRQKKIISEAYGEILPIGMSKLLSKINLSADDVFFDLGSGLGKMVLQVFLESVVKASYGIEIIPELYQQSVGIAQIVRAELPLFFEGPRQLDFHLGSFFEVPLNEATVVLIASPCFTPNIFLNLTKLIEQLDNIHTVLTLRPLCTLARLPFKKTIRIECSWDAALCYVYSSKPCN